MIYCQKLAGEQLVIFRNHCSIVDFCLRIAHQFREIQTSNEQLAQFLGAAETQMPPLWVEDWYVRYAQVLITEIGSFTDALQTLSE